MLQEIIPTKGKAKAAGIGATISGININFNKETITELGLKDHVCFGTDPEQPTKLYLFKDGVFKHNLNGEKKTNGSRYATSEDACKNGRLISGEFYPIKSDEQGKYIESDATAWTEPVKRSRTATKKANKDAAAEIAKKKEEKAAAEKSGGKK